MPDVAAEAGVSVALVSIVMRGAPGAGAATRERVLEVARRLGYRPDTRARLLRSGRSQLLGVTSDVRHPFHVDVLTGLYDAAERRRGYQEAMRRHGPAEHVRIISGGSGEEEGARAAAGLLEDPPTAVTVFNDLAATGLLDVVRGHGRKVPGELSVVGYDDSSFSRLGHLGLTTIAQDVTAMAGHAITRAVQRAGGTPVGERETVVAPRLVVRGTTAVPG
ncbi:LacI family DNA-binding transcriptional regulator [Actinoplanes sp. NPDC020271]|uniref:LacI family DNA-binding transcriptional regulator n=1 Tax=Actinoplanes sp. NPDC020271 TaxID=3363896 RepID=UPI0037A2AB7E